MYLVGLVLVIGDGLLLEWRQRDLLLLDGGLLVDQHDVLVLENLFVLVLVSLLLLLGELEASQGA